ncbi:acyl carrier protein [Hymenobacter gelipurpurascens]|uniref:Acyl carrier protein n=1 Tax=Hymenobacter gelipurpurascens TaxID=89968 RepID=A0A212THG0_9BACT|nr:acyl carrier protein [Hymenobacter gelipurpurascens]SNC65320.1 acyl carrier protein [Hymenobacter gelipurpurascens]
MKDAFWQQVMSLLPHPSAGGPLTAVSIGLGLDSLDFVELVLEVEKQFDIRFSHAELAELRTVQLLLSDIDQHLRRPLYAQFFAQLLQKSTWRL